MAEAFFVGLELNEKDVRICVYDSEKKEAVSIMNGEDGNSGDSPAHMAYDHESKTWCYGVLADHIAGQNDTVLYDSVYEKCLNDEYFPTRDGDVSCAIVLGELIKQAIEQTGIQNVAKDIRVLVVTVPHISHKLTGVVEKAFRYMGLSEKQGFLQDYNESLFMHTYYQNQDVYSKNVGLYYFPDDTTVQFKMLSSETETGPSTVIVEDSKTRSLSLNARERDIQFCNFIKETIKDRDFSGFFLVGKGFERYWAKDSLLILCKAQRKVFYGNNLFAKGACYSALEKTEKAKINNVIYLGKDLIRKNISLEIMQKNQPAYYPLITGTIHWYEAENSCEVILNGSKKLVFRVNYMESGKKINYSLPLENLPDRPDRTTRLKIRLKFESVDRCEVTVSDMGFGEMFPSSGLVWKDYL